MAAEEPFTARLPVNVLHSGEHAEPAACVFCELGIRGLKENLDAVEGTNYGFGLIYISGQY